MIVQKMILATTDEQIEHRSPREIHRKWEAFLVTTIPTPQAPSAQQQCHPHQETWGEDSARTPKMWMCYEDFRQNMEKFTRNGMLSSMETSEIKVGCKSQILRQMEPQID